MEDVALTNSILTSGKIINNLSSSNYNNNDSKETVFSFSESSQTFAPSARTRFNNRPLESLAETDPKVNNVSGIVKTELDNTNNQTNSSVNNKMYNKTQPQPNMNLKTKKLATEELLPSNQNFQSKSPLQTQQSSQQLVQPSPNTITVSETSSRAMSVKGPTPFYNQSQSPTLGNSATNINNNNVTWTLILLN